MKKLTVKQLRECLDHEHFECRCPLCTKFRIWVEESAQTEEGCRRFIAAMDRALADLVKRLGMKLRPTS